ncbi:MAG TPA: hypothetical protein VF595_06415 [Tepidisphaeraceae bacterium]
MSLITSLALIVCGLVAAASLIAKFRPDSQQVIEKITPYQGWIGLIVCLWGVWAIVSSVLNIGLVHHWPVLWLTLAATGLVEFALGFLLGFNLLTRLALSRNEVAMARGELVRAKLTSVQIPLGLAGVGLGVWCLLLTVVL